MSHPLQSMVRNTAPKTFRNIYDPALSAAQMLDGLAAALDSVASAASGRSAWTMGRETAPMPGLPSGREAMARTTYSHGPSSGALDLSISVVPDTTEGSVLLLVFADSLDWTYAHTETLVDLTMLAVEQALGRQWGQRGWRMCEGNWSSAHRFDPPRIDFGEADGDWHLPGGRTKPFHPRVAGLPDAMFEDSVYARYHFCQLWTRDRDRVHAMLLGCVRHRFPIIDERHARDEWCTTTMAAAGTAPFLHIRVHVYEQWGGVVATLSFALAEGWGPHALAPSIEMLLADLPQLAPALFPDGRGLQGPVLLPSAQADLFRFWGTSMMFGKRIWGSSADKMLSLLSPIVAGHFALDDAPGERQGTHVFHGQAFQAPDLRLIGEYGPSQGGALIGLSFADAGRWRDPAIRAIVRAAVHDIDATLHGLRHGLALEQALCMWSITVEGLRSPARETFQAVKEALAGRWHSLDRTPPPQAADLLILSGFLSVSVPVELHLTARAEGETMTIYLALRQNEFELPSVLQAAGQVTVAELKTALSRHASSVIRRPMVRPPIDRLWDLHM